MARIPPPPAQFEPPANKLHHKEIYLARIENRNIDVDNHFHMTGIHPDFSTYVHAHSQILRHLDNMEGYIGSQASCNQEIHEKLERIEKHKSDMLDAFDKLMRELLPIDPDDAYEG